jgi:hypothetical protein
MSAPQKLTDDQVIWVRHVAATRAEMIRQLQAYPTMKMLAQQLGVCKRYLADVVKGRERKGVPRETNC